MASRHLPLLRNLHKSSTSTKQVVLHLKFPVLFVATRATNSNTNAIKKFKQSELKRDTRLLSTIVAMSLVSLVITTGLADECANGPKDGCISAVFCNGRYGVPHRPNVLV